MALRVPPPADCLDRFFEGAMELRERLRMLIRLLRCGLFGVFPAQPVYAYPGMLPYVVFFADYSLFLPLSDHFR